MIPKEMNPAARSSNITPQPRGKPSSCLIGNGFVMSKILKMMNAAIAKPMERGKYSKANH